MNIISPDTLTCDLPFLSHLQYKSCVEWVAALNKSDQNEFDALNKSDLN